MIFGCGFTFISFKVSNADDSVQSSHKKLRPKPVVIAEHPPEHIVPTAASSSTADKYAASTMGGNKDHLETKKQIEMMRKQHGDSWLQNHGAKMEKLRPLSTVLSAKRDENAIYDEITDSFSASDVTLRASTPINPSLEGSIIKVNSSDDTFCKPFVIVCHHLYFILCSPIPVPTKRPLTMIPPPQVHCTHPQMNPLR